MSTGACFGEVGPAEYRLPAPGPGFSGPSLGASLRTLAARPAAAPPGPAVPVRRATASRRQPPPAGACRFKPPPLLRRRRALWPSGCGCDCGPVQSSLFSGTPRNASVRATTLVTLRVLNKVRLARARVLACMRARAGARVYCGCACACARVRVRVRVCVAVVRARDGELSRSAAAARCQDSQPQVCVAARRSSVATRRERRVHLPLVQHSATRRNTPQHRAARCSTFQLAAARRSALQHAVVQRRCVCTRACLFAYVRTRARTGRSL